MNDKIVIPHPSLKFWKVKLAETVGEVVMEGWVRHIPAVDKYQAGKKALMFHMRRNPGSRPSLRDIELEHYSRPLRIT